MTAGCITFEELESRTNEARQARWETSSVVARSKSKWRVDLGLLSQAAYQTLVLKHKLHRLANRQQDAIERLVDAEFFTTRTKKEITKTTARISDRVY